MILVTSKSFKTRDFLPHQNGAAFKIGTTTLISMCPAILWNWHASYVFMRLTSTRQRRNEAALGKVGRLTYVWRYLNFGNYSSSITAQSETSPQTNLFSIQALLDSLIVAQDNPVSFMLTLELSTAQSRTKISVGKEWNQLDEREIKISGRSYFNIEITAPWIEHRIAAATVSRAFGKLKEGTKALPLRLISTCCHSFPLSLYLVRRSNKVIDKTRMETPFSAHFSDPRDWDQWKGKGAQIRHCSRPPGGAP